LASWKTSCVGQMKCSREISNLNQDKMIGTRNARMERMTFPFFTERNPFVSL
jgi:hypothetical protein